eukprot:c18794_g1_i1.p1 GENE.c18794_g1_i1~~c18794_g1_i1.p1  ORF type:complete len:380 (+),score=35.47 c18794_g1_i1:58-1197(+)
MVSVRVCGRKVALPASLKTPVAELKQELATLLDVSESHFSLGFRSCWLDEARCLGDYGVGEQSELEAFFLLKGGAAYCIPEKMLPMFAPRPPLEYWPAPKEKLMSDYLGVKPYLGLFNHSDPLADKRQETRKERKERIQKENRAAHQQRLDDMAKIWDPQSDPNVLGDAFATLFVSRMSYETTDRTLKRAFEEYGPIRRVRVVETPDHKSRGYAFVEFESESDMKRAYKYGDGKKIDGRRVLVDVERGRTVEKWLPRRLGGGLGDLRAPKKPRQGKKKKSEKPPPAPAGSTYGPIRGGSSNGSKPSDRGRGERPGERSTSRGDRGEERGSSRYAPYAKEGRDSRDKDRERDRGDRDRERGGRGDRERGEGRGEGRGHRY